MKYTELIFNYVREKKKNQCIKYLQYGGVHLQNQLRIFTTKKKLNSDVGKQQQFYPQDPGDETASWSPTQPVQRATNNHQMQ